MTMTVTNQSTNPYWFGPLFLAGGVGQTLSIDDTSPSSMYLLNDHVADTLATLSLDGKITVVPTSGVVFPRPTGVPQILHGDGSPEGLVFASQGSLYMRRDTSGPTTSLFTKTTGVSLNTGWFAISTGASLSLLCSLVLSGTQASFDTNSLLGGNIPQSYNHLRVVLLLRGDTAAAATGLNLRFNNDSAANYDYQLLLGNGASATTVETFAAGQWQPGGVNAASAPAGVFSMVAVDIPVYAGTTANKVGFSQLTRKDSASSGGLFAEVSSGFWRSAAAITRIQAIPAAGNWAAGSAFYLYGIN